MFLYTPSVQPALTWIGSVPEEIKNSGLRHFHLFGSNTSCVTCFLHLLRISEVAIVLVAGLIVNTPGLGIPIPCMTLDRNIRPLIIKKGNKIIKNLKLLSINAITIKFACSYNYFLHD